MSSRRLAPEPLPRRRPVRRAPGVVGELDRPAPPGAVLGVLPALQHPDLPAGHENGQPVQVLVRPDLLPPKLATGDVEQGHRRVVVLPVDVATQHQPVVLLPDLDLGVCRSGVDEDPGEAARRRGPGELQAVHPAIRRPDRPGPVHACALPVGGRSDPSLASHPDTFSLSPGLLRPFDPPVSGAPAAFAQVTALRAANRHTRARTGLLGMTEQPILRPMTGDAMSQPAQQQTVPGVQSERTPTPDCGEDTYVGHGRLEGKTAVITGGDSGIGRAVAIAFAREGADVAISYLEEDDDAAETAGYVEDAGRKALLLPGDISDAEHCRAVIDAAVEAFGKIDILVNNAAYQMTHETLEEISDDEWDYTFRTNV